MRACKTLVINSCLLLFIMLICLSSVFPASAAADEKRPVDYVNPLVDSANSRWFFFTSACRPFGMVNLSPDTEVAGAWGSGYLYNTEFVHGMSHVHAWQLAGVPVMPVTGEMNGPKGSDEYGSRFSHDEEIVKAGYQSLVLNKYDIRAELTSTTRVGFHRYTFASDDQAHLLFNLTATLGPSKMVDAMARKVSDTEIEGYVVNGKTIRRPKDTRVFFVARFSKPMSEFGGWKGKKDLGAVDEVSGKGSGAYVTFPVKAKEKILVKVAISYCSIEGARKNLEAELPHWDFDRVVAESADDWNNWLEKIRVEGGTEDQRIKFYTDMWHSLNGRRIVSDIDGSYSDMTGPEQEIRQIPLDESGKPKYNHHNSDAFWGARWSLNLIWSLAYPKTMSDFCNTLVDMYENGGLIPRGPSGGNYTFVMTTATSTPFLVNAYQKGIRDFDVQTAYEGMRKNHFPGGLMSRAGYEHNSERGGGIEYYIKRGYIPEGRIANAFHVSGAGQTMECAYQDWCLAQMSKALGYDDDYEIFIDRAGNYRNLYDRKSGYIRPKTLLRTWWFPFKPGSRYGFVESNAYQMTYFVPHDVEGLIELQGGRDEFNRRLEETFEKASEHDFVASHNNYAVGINYANQPNMQPAHLFNYSGKPWLSQKWVRVVKEQAFGGITPEQGYRDDEDQGIIASLGALMAIGLFDTRGGCGSPPTWEITSPIFDTVTIELDQRYYPGREFTIRTINNSAANMYIQSATLNGEPLTKPWIYHSDIVGGGELVIELGPQPNTSWGSKPEDAPPSMSKP
jgi:predicted alpha-1,2-mannosidase